MPTSRLALLCAAAYLVATIGAGYILTREEYDYRLRTEFPPTGYPYPTDMPPEPTGWITPSTTRWTTTTTTAPSYPAAVRTVSAPNGLTTVVPLNWQVEDGDTSTTRVAKDPSGSGLEARFGGAPPTEPAKSLEDRITAAAAELEGSRDYRRIALSSSTLRGFPMVRWEYEYTRDGELLRVGAIYWEAAGVEYVVYVAGPASEWPETRTLLTTMAESARP